MTVIEEIAAERKRQVEVEGFTAEHDDQHDNGEISRAAACYAAFHGVDPGEDGFDLLSRLWPWAVSWWKPKNPRRNLIRAAALIVAEIERLDRIEEKQKDTMK